MKSEVLTQFPYMWLVISAQLIFFTVFMGSLIWIFRRGSRRFYDQLSRLPLEEESIHE